MTFPQTRLTRDCLHKYPRKVYAIVNLVPLGHRLIEDCAAYLHVAVFGEFNPAS